MTETKLLKARIMTKRSILQWLLGFYWLFLISYATLIVVFGILGGPGPMKGPTKVSFSGLSTVFGAFYVFLAFIAATLGCGKRDLDQFEGQNLFCFARFQFLVVGGIGLLVLPIHIYNLTNCEKRFIHLPPNVEEVCLALLIVHVAMFVLTFVKGCIAISVVFDIKELQQITGLDIEAPRLNRNRPHQNSNSIM